MNDVLFFLVFFSIFYFLKFCHARQDLFHLYICLLQVCIFYNSTWNWRIKRWRQKKCSNEYLIEYSMNIWCVCMNKVSWFLTLFCVMVFVVRSFLKQWVLLFSIHAYVEFGPRWEHFLTLFNAPSTRNTQKLDSIFEVTSESCRKHNKTRCANSLKFTFIVPQIKSSN